MLNINTDIDSFFKNNIRNNMIDSIDISLKVNDALNLLQKESTSNSGKIKLSEFLCHKLYNIYRLSIDKRNIIVDNLLYSVYNGDNLSIPLRLYYLQFRNEYIAYKVSINLFRNNIPFSKLETVPLNRQFLKDKINIIAYFQILKYIIRTNSDLFNNTDYNDVLNEFEYIFNHPNTSLSVKMEIADIYLLNNKLERGNEMINIVRREEEDLIRRREEEDLIRRREEVRNKHYFKTIYNDTQNVHNSTINNSVLKTAYNLINQENENSSLDNYINIKDIQNVLINIDKSGTRNNNIINVLERIQIDTSVFRYNNNIFGFSLYNVFCALWKFIQKHKSKDELLLRLIEEIVSMDNYCSTGHLSRFVNVIQGFTDDINLQIRISDSSQITIYINNYLNKILLNAPEDITDALIDDNIESKKLFYEFIKKHINEYIPILINELGEPDDYKSFYNTIISAISKYTQFNYWYFINNLTISTLTYKLS
jgi:hypothetical protein